MTRYNRWSRLEDYLTGVMASITRGQFFFSDRWDYSYRVDLIRAAMEDFGEAHINYQKDGMNWFINKYNADTVRRTVEVRELERTAAYVQGFRDAKAGYSEPITGMDSDVQWWTSTRVTKEFWDDWYKKRKYGFCSSTRVGDKMVEQLIVRALKDRLNIGESIE